MENQQKKNIEETVKRLLLRIEELKRTVKLGMQMRTIQNQYFENRNIKNLQEARRLEREFDALAHDVLKNYKERNLFT